MRSSWDLILSAILTSNCTHLALWLHIQTLSYLLMGLSVGCVYLIYNFFFRLARLKRVKFLVFLSRRNLFLYFVTVGTIRLQNCFSCSFLSVLPFPRFFLTPLFKSVCLCVTINSSGRIHFTRWTLQREKKVLHTELFFDLLDLQMMCRWDWRLNVCSVDCICCSSLPAI